MILENACFMNIYFRFRGTPYRVKREEKGNNSTESLVNT